MFARAVRAVAPIHRRMACSVRLPVRKVTCRSFTATFSSENPFVFTQTTQNSISSVSAFLSGTPTLDVGSGELRY